MIVIVILLLILLTLVFGSGATKGGIANVVIYLGGGLLLLLLVIAVAIGSAFGETGSTVALWTVLGIASLFALSKMPGPALTALGLAGVANARLRPLLIRASISPRGRSSVSDEAMFDAHCLALGHLCVAWAVIDRQLNELIRALTRASPAAIACITLSIDSVASRCEILRKLGYEDPISLEWASLFDRLTVRISQEIAPRRNRYIHDYWSISDGTLRALDRRAKVGRAQSRQPIALTFDSDQATSIDAVDQLRTEVGQTAFMLHAALRDADLWRQHRTRAAPPLLCRAFDLHDLPDVLRPQQPKQ